MSRPIDFDAWIQREDPTPRPCVDCERLCADSVAHPCPILLKFYEGLEQERRRIEE